MALKGIVESSNYTFNAGAKTITFSSDYLGMSLSDITYITNIKSGVATVIYDPFNATKGGELNGLELTLVYDTSTMNDSDPLQIIVGFTPVNSDPQLVRIVDTPGQQNNTDLLQTIADDLDLISLAMNDGELTPLNVKETSIKKDPQGAIIPSDNVERVCPQPLVKANDFFQVDTTGYNTIIFQIRALFGSGNPVVTLEMSQDGLYWFTVPFVYSVSNTNTTFYHQSANFTIVPPNGYYFKCSTTLKFYRLRVTTAATQTNVGVTAILRNSPVAFDGSIGPVNISQINGTAPFISFNSASFPTSLVQNSGGMGIAGFFQPTSNQVNASSFIQGSLSYPIGIAGREQPTINNPAGIFRYVTLDGGGKFVLGGDTPTTAAPFQVTKADGSVPGLPPRGVGGIPNNMVGAQNLTVTDTQQTDGDTHTMLLKQILQELKILNQQFTELPAMINSPLYSLSDPQEYRDDNSKLF
jgi:hypothetical protein